jgi:hypothetical protein
VPVPTSIDETAATTETPDGGGSAPSVSSLLAQMQPGRADEIGSAFRLPIRPNVRFFLAHTPEEWEPEVVKGTVAGVELDGVFWLPGVARRVLEPGAALIRTRQKGEPVEATYQHALEVSRREGWVWLDPTRHIPAECLPAGVPAGGYWRTMPCIDPRTKQTGDHHFEVWNLPAETLPNRRQRFDFHRESYNRWRAWLVLTGQVKPPLDYLLESIRNRMRDRVDRARSLPLPDNALAAKIKEAEVRAAIFVDAAVPSADARKAAPKRSAK